MSGKVYNLDQDNESPTIIMGGNSYTLHYPTIEDIEKLQDIKDETKLNDEVYGYIQPTTESAPPFKEAIKKQDIRRLKKLVGIIREEFGLAEDA